jgi:hypothetical protein
MDPNGSLGDLQHLCKEKEEGAASLSGLLPLPKVSMQGRIFF